MHACMWCPVIPAMHGFSLMQLTAQGPQMVRQQSDQTLLPYTQTLKPLSQLHWSAWCLHEAGDAPKYMAFLTLDNAVRSFLNWAGKQQLTWQGVLPQTEEPRIAEPTPTSHWAWSQCCFWLLPEAKEQCGCSTCDSQGG